MRNIEIVHSQRKTVAVEVKADGRVIVRAPIRMRDKEIKRFIGEKADWIEKHVKIMQEREAQRLPALSDEEIESIISAARADLPLRVQKHAAQMKVSVGRISIRNQKSRWGSCSSKGNINLNCLLMLCPEEIRDYVVVHELAHRLEMNHSQRFWSHVERELPDYKTYRKWMKENGNAIIGRVMQ